MSTFQDRVAFVTGGASGIGRALGRELHRRGARVVLVDIDQQGVEQAASELGSSARGVALDVTDAQAMQDLVKEVAAEKGLDFIFNNAGIGVVGEVRDLQVSDWNQLLDVNLRGVINGVMAAYPIMVEQGRGHVVNMASLSGLVPTPGLVPYSTSKHAVVGLSKGLRAEARLLGVRVSCVCPGMIQTPMLDRARFVRVDGEKLKGKLMFGAISAEKAAQKILRGVEKNRGVILPTTSAKISVYIERFFPWLVTWIANRMARELQSARQT